MVSTSRNKKNVRNLMIFKQCFVERDEILFYVEIETFFSCRFQLRNVSYPVSLKFRSWHDRISPKGFILKPYSRVKFTEASMISSSNVFPFWWSRWVMRCDKNCNSMHEKLQEVEILSISLFDAHLGGFPFSLLSIR